MTLRTNESDYNKRDQVLLVKLNEEISVEEAVRTFNASDMVNYAEPNYVVELEPLNDVEEPNTTDSLGNRSIILNDPNWCKQANLREISMPSAWEETKGSKDVKVAVIDSGIDYQHEDLSGNVDESLGYDFLTMIQILWILWDMDTYCRDYWCSNKQRIRCCWNKLGCYDGTYTCIW